MRRRCCCPSGTAVVGFYVRCGSTSGTLAITPPATGTVGIAVALYSDVGRTTLVASGVTGSTGRASLAGLAAGTYYRRIGGNPGWSTYDPPGSITLTSTSNVGYNYTLATDGTQGCRPCCTDEAPTPATLNCSTTWGSCTLTLNAAKTLYIGIIPGVAYSTTGTLASGCPGTVDITITLNIFGCSLGFSFPWGSNAVATPDGYSCCPGATAITAGGSTGIAASPTQDCGPGLSLTVGGAGAISGLGLTGCNSTALRIFYGSGNTYAYSITVTE